MQGAVFIKIDVLQVVLLGVYLLAPGKRAYLRSLKDTEEVLLQHRWCVALCWRPADVCVMPKVNGSAVGTGDMHDIAHDAGARTAGAQMWRLRGERRAWKPTQVRLTEGPPATREQATPVESAVQAVQKVASIRWTL